MMQFQISLLAFYEFPDASSSCKSASYAGLEQWGEAVDDAKECIKLDPGFMKGYYRLATAQLAMKDYDAAMASIKQGLSLDANNSQLLKLMRNIKEAQRTKSVHTTDESKLDVATSQELYDLQMQLAETTREYNRVQANLSSLQRDHRVNQITLRELETNPSDGAHFRNVGKIFVKRPRENVFEHLKGVIEGQGKKQADLSQKMQLLEKRLQSQKQNVQEVGAAAR